MNKNNTIILDNGLSLIFAGCGEKDNTAPHVVSTFPSNGSEDVDPSINQIAVTFNEMVTDANWSWAYTKISDFPTMRGDSY